MAEVAFYLGEALNPDHDLECLQEDGPRTRVILPPRLEELCAENREALKTPPLPTIRTPRGLREQIADVMEDVGCRVGLAYWGAVRKVRGTSR